MHKIILKSNKKRELDNRTPGKWNEPLIADGLDLDRYISLREEFSMMLSKDVLKTPSKKDFLEEKKMNVRTLYPPLTFVDVLF